MRGLPISVMLVLACLLVWLTPIRASAQPGHDPLPMAQETAVERLADLLSAREVNIRIQAATRLKQLGDTRGFSVVAALLHDKDPDVCESAVRALGKFADSRAGDLLVPLLHDANADVRHETAFSLGMLRDQRAVIPLLDLVSANDSRLVEEALKWLRELISWYPDVTVRNHAVEVLLNAATAEEWDYPIHVAALSALEPLQDPRIVFVLCKLLNDPSKRVRIRAAEQLGRRGDASAVPALMAHAHDDEVAVRRTIFTSLGELGDARATDLLLAALEDDKLSFDAMDALAKLPSVYDTRIADRLAGLLNSDKPGTRDRAALLLAKMGDPRAIEVLTAQLNAPQKSIEAFRALLGIDDPRAAAALIAALPAYNADMRNSLVNQADQRGNPRLFDIARAMYAQQNVSLREWAVRNLTPSEDPRATQLLTNALQDKAPTVRKYALQALNGNHETDSALKPQILQSAMTLWHDADQETRSYALRLLVQLKVSNTRELLLAAVHDPYQRTRDYAITSLGSLSYALARNDEQIVSALLDAGKDTDQGIRRIAIAMLSYYPGDRRVPDALFAAANDPSPDIRDQGLTGLLMIEDSRAVALLVALLKQMPANDYGRWVGDIRRSNDPHLTDAVFALLPTIAPEKQLQLATDLWLIGDRRAAAPVLQSLIAAAQANDLFNRERPAFSRTGYSDSFYDGSFRQALYRLRGAAVEPLLPLLTNAQRPVRLFALDGLMTSRDARAFAPLLNLLQDHDAMFRHAAVIGLGALGDVRAVPSLLTCLHDTDSDIRADICRALGRIGDRRAGDSLIEMLHDPCGDVRYTAMEALGELAEIRAVPTLLKLATDDPDAGVRRQAIQTLGKLPDPRAFETLMTLLHNTDQADVYPVIDALGKLRDPRTSDDLLAIAISKPRTRLKEERNSNYFTGLHYGNRLDYSIQTAAASALVKIGDPRAIDICLKLFAENLNSSYATSLIYALGTQTDPRAINAVIHYPHLHEYDYFVWTLMGKLKTAALPTLCVALRDRDRLVRRRAIYAIDSIVGEEKSADGPTREALLAALYDEDADVCGKVASALLAVNEPRAVPEIAKILTEQSSPAYVKIVEASQGASDLRLLLPLLTIAIQQDGNRYCREKAINGIAHIISAHPGATEMTLVDPPLMMLLQERHQPLRIAAIHALGYLHDPRTAPALLPLLEDREVEVRHTSAIALAELGDQRAIAPLLTWLQDTDSYYHRDLITRRDAVKALAHFHRANVIDALITALRDPEPYISYYPTRTESVREQAALSLGVFGDPRAVPALIEALDYGYLPGRRRAAEALGMLKDKRAVAPLIAALRHFAGDAASAPAAALKAITGQYFGLDADRWQTWWDGVGKNG